LLQLFDFLARDFKDLAVIVNTLEHLFRDGFLGHCHKPGGFLQSGHFITLGIDLCSRLGHTDLSGFIFGWFFFVCYNFDWGSF